MAEAGGGLTLPQPASPLPASRFHTGSLPRRERFGAWRESIGVFLDASRPRTIAGRPFDAAIESYLLDGVIVGRCRANAQKFDRAPRRIARDGLDHYMIQVFLQGGVEMGDRRHAIDYRTGAIVGFDLAERLDSFNEDFDLVYAMVPRQLLAPRLATPDSLHGLVVSPEIGAGDMAARFLRDLHALAPRLSAREGEVMAQSLLGLVALAFDGATLDRESETREVRHADLLRAQAIIRQRLASPALGPGAIAAEMGISRTKLYAVFEPVGGVAGYIREMRLRRALRQLMSSRHAHRQIADIAYGCGFADPAAFTRAFRARFGCAPREIRLGEACAARAVRRELGPQVGDRMYEDWIAGLG